MSIDILVDEALRIQSAEEGKKAEDETVSHREGDVLSSRSTCVLPAIAANSGSWGRNRPSSTSGRNRPSSSCGGSNLERSFASVREDGSPLADFKRKTAERVSAHCQLVRKKRNASKPKKYAHIDVDAHVQWTKQQVREVTLRPFRNAPGERPARVAVVGAGPVGLWVSVLMAREHSFLADTHVGAPRITRTPSAPSIDLFERRGPESFGSRRIVLAMSNASQDLLNRHLVSDRCITSNHAFSPTCSINFIEATLRENFDRYACARFGKFNFDAEIGDPESLFDHGYDVVIVAGGRQSLPDDWRQPRGLDLCTNNSEMALSIKFASGPGAVRHHSLAESSLARLGHQVFIRPGASDSEGYVWILGLPSEFAAKARAKLASHVSFTHFLELRAILGELLETCNPEEIVEALDVSPVDGKTTPAESASEPCSPKLASSRSTMNGEWLSQLLNLLDETLRPVSVTARVTTAAYWRSTEVVHLARDWDGNAKGWLVLVGDAACGRPFHLGTNLNGHFADIVSLVRGTSWSRWDPEGQPFRKYVERYRVRTSTPGFKRTFHA